MIYLDLNLSYLQKVYGIDAHTMSMYNNKSIDEVMEAEAAQGNTQAANFEHNIVTDPDELIKLYQLSDQANRLNILRNVGTQDLQKMMEYLGPDVLYNALYLMTQDKLSSILKDMPKEKIATVVFNTFPVQDFVQMIPEMELNKFFQSTKLERNDFYKSLDGLEPKMLQGIMEQLTGQPCQVATSRDVREKMQGLSNTRFNETIMSMPYETKGAMIVNMTQERPEYLLEFSKEAMMAPLATLEKEDFMKSLRFLEPEDFLVMAQQMPDEFMPLVVSEIDPEVFAELLLSDFKDLLAQIALA